MRADQIRRLRRRPRRQRRQERGAALIMVLLSIVVLTVFLTEVQQETSVAFASAISARERLKAEYNAKSAVNLGRLLIAAEPTIRNTVRNSPLGLAFAAMSKNKFPQIPVWNFADQLLAPYNCPERAEDFTGLTGVDLTSAEAIGLGEAGGCFELKVVDESAKLNVNVAARGDAISRLTVAQQLMGLMSPPQYQDFFAEKDADGQFSNAQTICSAIVDWADYDQDVEPCDLSGQATNAGAEDNYYQTIGLPYLRKNAAYDSLEELRLVRGFGDTFWSTFVDPDPSDPDKRVLTVWGEGKINVNSANPQTLYGVTCAYAVEGTPLCSDPTQAQQFLQIIGFAKAFSMGLPAFSRSTQFIAAMEGKGAIGTQMVDQGIQPVQFQNKRQLKAALSINSKIFSIYAAGVVPARGRETRVGIHTVIDFRNATEIDQMNNPAAAGAQQAGGGQTGIQGLQPGQTQSGGAGGTGDPTADLATALASDPAGQVIYYRIE